MLKRKNIKIHPIEGIQLSSVCSGMYPKRRYDLSLVKICEGSNVSGVFTKNKAKAAPVLVSQKNIKSESLKYLVINAGNANAGTGSDGIKDIKDYCSVLSEETSCNFEDILVFSTGLIGQRIKVANIKKNIPKLIKKMKEDNWESFSKSILTTDTCTKTLSERFKIGSEVVTITGVAKGSGMIMPNMATMLSFVATNIKINKKELDKMLIQLTEQSFNMITVDSDTSTNDSSILISTGKTKISYEKLTIEDRKKFYFHLQSIYIKLAKKIIKDAEGATKFISINVKKIKNKKYGKSIGMSVANSPLVKTALFAEDPNWGRILSAIGNSDIKTRDINKLEIYLGKYLIFKNNTLNKKYKESSAIKYLKEKNIDINIVLNNGNEEVTVWTSDLTHKYIKINAEYRS